jgi:CO/xanthine dehydrogenase Mo-binding subunit
MELPVTRRSFLKIVGSGVGVSLTVHSLPALAGVLGTGGSAVSGSGPDWAPVAGTARWRIDGMKKVLGQKIYARDFAARDFPAWPQQQENWLYALRCDRSDAAVLGYDLSLLPAELKPLTVIDGAILAAQKMQPKAANMNSPFFTKIGNPPDFYGQPVAMLIFADFNSYRRAVKILQFNPNVVQYGADVAPTATPYAPITHYVRDDTQGFSYVYSADYNARQYQVDADVRKAIHNSPWLKFSRSFYTQTIDPMFMEPESGLAWYDPAQQQLHLVLGTQSPTGDLTDCTSIYVGTNSTACPPAPYQANFGLKSIDLVSCYPGGGFGGRDQSYFPMYLAMAAPFAKAPLRWAQNRFEQFQVGLKRCETEFSETLAIDKNGLIQGLLCNYLMNGGGERNLSPYVVQLAALSSMNCYNIPRTVAGGGVSQTRQLLGGSQRGFGGPQAFMAIETLLDEAAGRLKIDPFALRRKNLLSKFSGATVTGAPIIQDLQLDAIMNKLEQHPLWQQREQQQKAMRAKGLRYGVGFAMSNEAYGTSGDGMFGAVEIGPEGGLVVHTPYVDMGNGAATALGLAPARGLGRNAQMINMGEAALFNSLGLTTTAPPPPPEGQKPGPYPQNYVVKASGSSSACLGAFYQFHVVEQAALTLLIQSVLPAANALWGSKLTQDDVKWQDGKLTAPNLSPLGWDVLRQKITALGLPTFSAVHASFVVEYVTAEFVFGSGAQRLPLDYIAMGSNSSNLQNVTRKREHNPGAANYRFGRSTYAPCGALVAASIDPRTGQVKIEQVVSVLSAGVQHCHQLVSGQSQGGIAMAIGNVLLEDCPIGPDGPGNGTWNLNRYHVARATDIPQQELIVLPPAEGETTGRGIAEAVFCPIGPAILNALAMATGGKRFTRTPITAQHVLEAIK